MYAPEDLRGLEKTEASSEGPWLYRVGMAPGRVKGGRGGESRAWSLQDHSV